MTPTEAMPGTAKRRGRTVHSAKVRSSMGESLSETNPSFSRSMVDEVSGVAFEKGSFDGETVPGGIPLGEGDDALATFLSDNGKTLRDVKIAVASPADTAAGGGTLVMAIQVEGVAQDKLEEFAASSMDEGEKSTVGGKEVYGAGMAGFGAYVYVKDDVIFYVLSMGGDASATDAIFEQLP